MIEGKGKKEDCARLGIPYSHTGEGERDRGKAVRTKVYIYKKKRRERERRGIASTEGKRWRRGTVEEKQGTSSG